MKAHCRVGRVRRIGERERYWFWNCLSRRVSAASGTSHRSSQAAVASAGLNQLIQRYPAVQLATLVDQPPEGAGWLHETKFDGYRLLGFLSQGIAVLRTRNGKDWTGSFSPLAAAMQKLDAKDAVVDMEAVVLDESGKSSFQALQASFGDGRASAKIVAYAFDLLYLNGRDLTPLPLVERKEKLRKLLSRRGSLHYSEHVEGRGSEILGKACKAGLEGIISKRAEAPYRAGRQNGWLKSKCLQRQEFIILGYSGARSGDRALGALYLGYRQKGSLRYAGKVGTGFSMKSARDLADRFESMAVADPVIARSETGIPSGEWQAIRWIQPLLLCEVSFTEWTQDGRIRHPSFQGLREDKDASEVKKETPMATKTAAAAAEKKAAGLVLHDVAITHPDRVISETGHITKGQLAEYYAAAAPFLLPQIARRPVSLLRCPSGLDHQCFYQRNPGKGLGPDVHTFDFKHNGKSFEYLYIEDEKGLMELIQMGAVELHPWGSRIDAIDYPDWMIFDLDPAPEVPVEALKLAAQDLKKRLANKGLESWLKCTGGKGLHVTVQLAGRNSWAEVKSFAGAVAQEMVAAAPAAYIATMSKAKRAGKIFIDFFRNDYTATAIAGYAVRARPGAPVALPIEWKELKKLKSPSQFTMADVLERIKKKKAAPQPAKGQTLPKA
jgi:bifunctional non-homologous end joining protein LigD